MLAQYYTDTYTYCVLACSLLSYYSVADYDSILCIIRSVRIARPFSYRAVYLNMPMFLGLMPLFGLIGLAMYAYYAGCDPLLQGRISRKDQVGNYYNYR